MGIAPAWELVYDSIGFPIHPIQLCEVAMSGRIIRLEEQAFVDSEELEQLMRLAPADQRDDIRLKRFLAFRLKLDGLVATQVYLSNKLMTAEKLAYRGGLYDFLCEGDAPSGDTQN